MARLASRRLRQLVLNVLIVVDGVHGEIGKKRTGWPQSDGFGHHAQRQVAPFWSTPSKNGRRTVPAASCSKRSGRRGADGSIHKI